MLALTNAFSKLDYEEPEQEATRMLIDLDGLATRYFLMQEFDIMAMITFLKKKYKV